MIVDFIKLWRQHFLDTMKPKRLPFMWESRPGIYEKFGLSAPTDEDCARVLSCRV